MWIHTDVESVYTGIPPLIHLLSLMNIFSDICEIVLVGVDSSEASRLESCLQNIFSAQGFHLYSQAFTTYEEYYDIFFSFCAEFCEYLQQHSPTKEIHRDP